MGEPEPDGGPHPGEVEPELRAASAEREVADVASEPKIRVDLDGISHLEPFRSVVRMRSVPSRVQGALGASASVLLGTSTFICSNL